jgi:hypothetical protein
MALGSCTAGDDEFLAARRVDCSPDVRMRPGMRRRAVDGRHVGEDIADFLEDGVDENAALGADRGQHRRHAQVPRHLCEGSDIVDHDSAIDGRHGKGDHRLVIDEQQHRILNRQFVWIVRHESALRFKWVEVAGTWQLRYRRVCDRGSLYFSMQTIVGIDGCLLAIRRYLASARTGILTRAHAQNLLAGPPAILFASAISSRESEPS